MKFHPIPWKLNPERFPLPDREISYSPLDIEQIQEQTLNKF